MNYSDTTQKAALDEVIRMLRLGRMEGGREAMAYHANVLGSIRDRIENYEKRRAARDAIPGRSGAIRDVMSEDMRRGR